MPGTASKFSSLAFKRSLHTCGATLALLSNKSRQPSSLQTISIRAGSRAWRRTSRTARGDSAQGGPTWSRPCRPLMWIAPAASSAARSYWWRRPTPIIQRPRSSSSTGCGGRSSITCASSKARRRASRSARDGSGNVRRLGGSGGCQVPQQSPPEGGIKPPMMAAAQIALRRTAGRLPAGSLRANPPRDCSAVAERQGGVARFRAERPLGNSPDKGERIIRCVGARRFAGASPGAALHARRADSGPWR